MSKSPTYVGSRPMGTAPHHTYGNPPCLQAGFRVISWKPTLLEVRPLIPEHLRVVGRWSGDFLPAPPRWLHKRSVLRSASFIFVFEHVSHQHIILETTAKQLNPTFFFLFCFFFSNFFRQTKTQTAHFKPLPNLTCQFLKNQIFILV